MSYALPAAWPGLPLAKLLLINEAEMVESGVLGTTSCPSKPRGGHMASPFAVALDASCPLCGTAILSVGRGGRVEAGDLHPVPLYKHPRGEGFMLCDDCGMLAELPPDVTLN
jgi:hypothetical protein